MIELKSISAGYGKSLVLDGVNASLEKGKLTCIIGENGCGKSTLLKSIAGILQITSGEMIIDGDNLSTLGRGEIAKRIAYLAQSKSTPDMTVEQMVLHGRFPYLTYPRRYREEDKLAAKTAMESVGISQLANRPLSELSGGIRQNAYIAMALAQDTNYILLDEPTTYLDVAHRLDLMRLLRRLANSGKGIVIVMHDLPLALDFSDSIVVIKNGEVAAHASPAEIFSSPLIREIFGVDIEKTDNSKFYYNY